MKKLTGAVLLVVLRLTAARAQSPTPGAFPTFSAIPTWSEEIAQNFVPYHQLTTNDFAVREKGSDGSAFYIRPFMHYFYHVTVRPGPNGILYGYVIDWTIFTGLDKNQTWRISSLRNFKNELPYAQAYLDLNEIVGRQLAALKATDIPSGQGWNMPELHADLRRKVDEFLTEKSEAVEAEGKELAHATNSGRDLAKAKKMAAAIRQRLEALPPIPSPRPPAGNPPEPAPVRSGPAASPPR
ncbi:MAG: hypothetical protein ABI839_05350 [Verrucomicrobiota bacterium]